MDYSESKFRIFIKKLLFALGILFVAYSVTALVINVISLARVPWEEVTEIPVENVLGIIISFLIIAIQFIIGVYCIYSRKNVDDVINALFNISIIYLIFSAAGFIQLFASGWYEYYQIYELVFEYIDFGLAILLFIYSLCLKAEDWLPTELD